MFGKHETEVLVAGAGPVGLYSALLLAGQGVRVRVLDEQYRGTTRSYALALHPRTLELMDEIGLAAELVAAGTRVERLAFYGAGKRLAEIRFTELKSRYPFVLVLPQSTFEAALEARLAERKVEVGWSQRLAGLELGDARATARVQRLGKESMGYATAHTEWVVEDESEIRAAFVVGADGHRSRVRRDLGLSFDSVGPAQSFAVFEFTAGEPSTHELQVVIGERTSVMWPLGGGRYRWSFEIDARDAEEAEREKSRLVVVLGQQSFRALDPAVLQRLIGERAPWFEPRVGELAWSLAARFERRLASGLGRGAAWLAGDAAHLAPPMSMRSMNLGLWEARELCSRMAGVLRQGRPHDELSRFAAQWSQTWRRLVTPGSGFVAGAEASPWVREHAAAIADAVPVSGDELAGALAQLGILQAAL